MVHRFAAGAAIVAAMLSRAEAGEAARIWPPAYVSGRVGLEIGNANQFRFGKGVVGAVAAGATVGERWRAELAVAKRTTPITDIPPLRADGDFTNWSVMLNGYYHPLKRSAKISPYLGAGVGYTTSKLSGYSTESNPLFDGLGYVPQRHTMIGAQGIVGVSVRATKRLNIDLAGVYFTTGDRDYISTFPNNPTVEAAYRTYSAQIGFRFSL